MLRLNDINLDLNPGLIQPPKINDNIVCIKLIADKDEIIATDIIDVALSYAIAGIDVILEMHFKDAAKFNNKQLASFICNGGWSLSLLPPNDFSKPLLREYNQHIIAWYQIWRSSTMRNFEKIIYPVTPYLEYLSTNYLIEKNHSSLSDNDKKELTLLSQNPTDEYLVNFIDNMKIGLVAEFKQKLNEFIQQKDQDFYKDIDLLTDTNEKQ